MRLNAVIKEIQAVYDYAYEKGLISYNEKNINDLTYYGGVMAGALAITNALGITLIEGKPIGE